MSTNTVAGLWSSVSSLQHLANMNCVETKQPFRKTSIICTIGPKTNSPEAMLKLRNAGMNVVRMNFSHGSHEYHSTVIANIRKSLEDHPGRPVAIALDTKGPEIRTGLTKDDSEVSLSAGQEWLLTTDEAHKESGDEKTIYVDYKNLPKVVNVGGLIYVDDGLISLEVLEKAKDLSWVRTKVLNSATITSRRGVNLPGVAVDLPAVSAKDKKDLTFGVEQGVDMIFASFIRKASDVVEVRNVLGPKGKAIKIISKIENQEGILNFDEILKVTDGVMVARGDLGIEIPAEDVFLAQKMMIAKCNLAGKPIICATQMLESMTFNPRPTRAEVSDVANAVLDGADCVMLSGETAKGKYPCESVTTMHNVCCKAETAVHYRSHYMDMCKANPTTSIAEAVASSAVMSAATCSAKAIIVLTTSGKTAALISKYRPQCEILCVTHNAMTSRQVHLHRGVTAKYYPEATKDMNPSDYQEDRENRIHFGMQYAKELKFVAPGDAVVLVLGSEVGKGKPNVVRIATVDDDDKVQAKKKQRV